MKIAAIDVGSNSIHMIIVESQEGIDFEIVDREKEMVRLGSGSFARKALTEPAMGRAEACLRKYKQLADRLGVEKIIAKATSAVREATNGGDFLARIRRRVGIHLGVMTASEEAQLIALAVRQSIDFRGRRALLIDIGGGSIELSLCDAGRGYFSESCKLGVIRLTEKFVKRDPIQKKTRRAIDKFVRKRVTEVARQARQTGFDFAIGTSGTILTLADLAHQVRTGKSLGSFNHQILQREHLVQVNKRIQGMTFKERTRLSGVNPGRAATIVAGGILLETLMRVFRVNRLTLCTRALREGMVLDFLTRSRERVGPLDLESDVRRRSVLELARRSQFDRPHAEWVAETAVRVFEATRRWHQLDGDSRELLEYGALLHDIGIHISYTRHHRHSHYLIMNSGLRGFSPDEIEQIALLARFHRKGEPSAKEAECARMPRKKLAVLRVLSAILRLADGLDRSHHQILHFRSLHCRRNRWRFDFQARDDAELELWGARRKAGLFEKVFRGKIDFHVTLTRR